MDELGMKKTKINSKLKRISTSLHEKIVQFKNQNSELGDALLAVKWIGNPGSHSGSSISNSDLLDAYEILEHILHELYDTKKKGVKKIVKMINKRKKPRSSIKRRRLF